MSSRSKTLRFNLGLDLDAFVRRKRKGVLAFRLDWDLKSRKAFWETGKSVLGRTLSQDASYDFTASPNSKSRWPAARLLVPQIGYVSQAKFNLSAIRMEKAEHYPENLRECVFRMGKVITQSPSYLLKNKFGFVVPVSGLRIFPSIGNSKVVTDCARSRKQWKPVGWQLRNFTSRKFASVYYCTASGVIWTGFPTKKKRISRKKVPTKRSSHHCWKRTAQAAHWSSILSRPEA